MHAEREVENSGENCNQSHAVYRKNWTNGGGARFKRKRNKVCFNFELKELQDHK